MELTRAKRLWKEFDPVRSLTSAEQGLYVERADSLAKEFHRRFLLSSRDKHVLTGAVGSGKSTELVRLAGQLARQTDGPIVGLVRLHDHFEVQGLAPAQVLLVLAVAALRLSNQTPPRELQERLGVAFQRVQDPQAQGRASNEAELLGPLLKGLVVTATAALGDAGQGLVDPAAATPAAGALGQLIARLPLPRVQPKLAVNDTPVAELIDVANEGIHWARRQLGDRPLVLFADGLDKIPDPEQVEEVFGNGILDRLELSLVLSAPLTLRIDPNEATQRWRPFSLGNFRVVRPDGSPDPEHLQRMRQIFVRRCGAAGVGPEEAVVGGDQAGGPLDRLAAASGGLTRDFIQLCQTAIEHAADDPPSQGPIDNDHVDGAIAELRRRYELVLDEQRIRLLLECLDRGIRPNGQEADRLLYSNHLLGYFNGMVYYRPHPLVVPYLMSVRPRLALADG